MVPLSWILKCLRDGWGCIDCDLNNQQQHGELENSIYVERNDSWAG